MTETINFALVDENGKIDEAVIPDTFKAGGAQSIDFAFPGALAVQTGVLGWVTPAGTDIVLKAITVTLGTPTTYGIAEPGGVVLDVRANGASIFAPGVTPWQLGLAYVGNRALTNINRAQLATVVLSSQTVITVDVVQTGPVGLPGGDAVLQLWWDYA